MQTGQNQQKRSDRFVKVLQRVRYSIDVIAAILLLSGQITTSGVYIVPSGFFLAGCGPILGGDRMTGFTGGSTMELDAIDVINAFLLIIGQVHVTGPYFTSGRVFLVWTGEIFGVESAQVTDPFAERRRELSQYMKREMLRRYS